MTGLRFTSSLLYRSKPPNILVYSQEVSAKTFLVETLRSVVRIDTHTVYPVAEEQMVARAWLDSTALLLVHGQLDSDVAKVALDYFLGGGKVLSVCSNLLGWILPSRVKCGESKMHNVRLDYDKWQNVTMRQELLELIGETNELTEIVRDSNGLELEIKGTILVRESTFKTPSILRLRTWKTGGEGIFTQLCLDRHVGPEREILQHLLDNYLKISIETFGRQEQSQYKNAFLIGSASSKNNFLQSTTHVLNLGALELQFCRSSQSLPATSDTTLPVIIDRNPEDFSTQEYFKHLETSFIGRIAIYCPTVTSSMDIVSNATLSHGFVVIPRRQTRGNGRNNNQWLSPDGCAMFSLQLHVPLISALGQRLPIIQHLVAVAVVKAIRAIPGYEELDIGVKWPNDIYASGCTKIGGLIINSQLCGSEAIVNVGCGVNLNNSIPTLCINDLIREYNNLEGTNLPLLGYEQTLAMIFNEIEKLFIAIQSKDDLQDLYDLYYKYWLHSNKSVIVKDADKEEISGTISGIDDYGFLLVRKTNNDRAICVHPDGNSFDMMKGLIIPKYF